LRLPLERRQESFRAKEKPQASRKNKLVYFSACPAVFRCAHAHSRASFAGLPESGEQHSCFSLRLLLLRR